ncbi:MAG TPA: hypothetical protein VGO11_23710 [Chthoniobacteraceae bacterium]|jgi:hypothetical protein|nr:hypothetical protein [Chthoniobacteraceae bacterium]
MIPILPIRRTMRAFLVCLLSLHALAQAEVVVAIRYLQIEGVSHAHLWLFDDAGKPIRQLTAAKTGQDEDPQFSPAGTEIVFVRTEKEQKEWRSISVTGKGERLLDQAPAWYPLKAPAPFDYPPDAPIPNQPGRLRLEESVKPGELKYATPDGRDLLFLRDVPERADPADSYYPKAGFLRDVQTGTEKAFEEMPITTFVQTGNAKEDAFRWGGASLKERAKLRAEPAMRWESQLLDSLLLRDGSPFLIAPPLRVAFFRQHRGSTYGDGRFAIDLNTRRITELTPNGGARIHPLPNELRFVCVCGERYRPLGDGRRIVNCSYLDQWDAALHRIRFAEARPAIFHGASILREGKAPVAIPRLGDE